LVFATSSNFSFVLHYGKKKKERKNTVEREKRYGRAMAMARDRNRVPGGSIPHRRVAVGVTRPVDLAGQLRSYLMRACAGRV